jgi:TRAP-type C4-dicarboxylate transport system substrate-binding protein
MQQKKLIWLIAHEPIDLFLKASKKFAREVYEKTNGEYDIEILSLGDYSTKYNNGVKIGKADALRLMEEEKVDLSQLFTYFLGDYHKDYWALEMPFLFDSHEQVDHVFEGQIGTRMLDELADVSPVRGLAFTYSGGYKCIPAKQAINNIEDFNGLRIRTCNNPVSRDIFTSVGAVPVDDLIENMKASGLADRYEGGESTYVRIFQSDQHHAFPTINDAEHSLLATTIIISDKLWKGLSTDIQEIFKAAAVSAGRAERRESVELVDNVKDECHHQHIPVVTMSEEEKARFKQATAWMYDKYNDFFSPGLIDNIKKTI